MESLDYIPENIEQIQRYLEFIKQDGAQIPFDENDVRTAFFGLIYDVVDNYYRGVVFVELIKSIGAQKILIEKTEIINRHIENLIQIAVHPDLFASHRNNINRSILTDSWSAFELGITVLSDHALAEEVKSELLEEQYIKIIDGLKGAPIEEQILKKLKRQFIKNHLTHVSINRKCDKLFKLIEANYERVVDSDKLFLTFYGKYRNCLHSNYIYYGNDFSYTFEGVNFSFENRKPVRSDKMDFTYHPNLVMELGRIFKAVAVAINFDEMIPYP